MVPLWKKLAYAVGSMAFSMCFSVVAFYFVIFLLEVVIVSRRVGASGLVHQSL